MDSDQRLPRPRAEGDGRKLVGTLPARRPAADDGGWRTFKLRQDFIAADKVQTEDDITASVVVPAGRCCRTAPAGYDDAEPTSSSINCECAALPAARRRDPPRARPADRSRPGPAGQLPVQLRAAHRRRRRATMVERRHRVRRVHRRRCSGSLRGRRRPGTGYVVCSAHPRLVDGKPSKNPRYLQIRPGPARPARPLPRRVGACGCPAAIPADRARWSSPSSAVLRRPAEQPPGPRRRHPGAGGLQPDPLPGAARAVHGFHLLADRQEPLDHRGRLRRGADQGPVQRPAARPPT